MVGHGGSSASSYLADPTSPIPSHCASIVATSTLRVNVVWDLENKVMDWDIEVSSDTSFDSYSLLPPGYE